MIRWIQIPVPPHHAATGATGSVQLLQVLQVKNLVSCDAVTHVEKII